MSTASQISFRFKLLRDFQVAERGALPWLVKDILPSGGLAFLYGPPGVGKTFIALDLAFSVATGRPWQGHETRHGTVVYIAAEGTQGMAQRINAWKGAHGVGQPTQVYFLETPVQLHNEDQVQRLVTELKQQVASDTLALIVVDTMARCFVGGDENSARDAGKFLRGAKTLQSALGAAVVVVHHTTKSGEAERGSSALRGAADTMIEVTQGAATGIRIACDKQKDAPAFADLRLKLEPWEASCVLEPLDDSESTECLSPGALAALRVLGTSGGPMRYTKWADKSGAPPTSFERCRKAVLRLGLVHEDETGAYVLTPKGALVAGVTTVEVSQN